MHTHKLWVHITMHHHHHAVEWQREREREREKGLEEEGKNKEKGVVFVGDFVAHHDGEWIVVVAK